MPVVEMTLAAADSVFFEHHTMLWKDETVPMAVMNTPGGAKRLLSGMPFVLSVARGPGRVAFSRDAPGEIIVIPVEAPAEVDVREHALVLASGTLTYSFEKLPGLRAMLVGRHGHVPRPLRGPVGARACSCCTVTATCSSARSARARPSWSSPGGFLYKDSSVTMELASVNFKGDRGQRHRAPAAGPARVRVQRRAPAAAPSPLRSASGGPSAGASGASRGPSRWSTSAALASAAGQPAFGRRPRKGWPPAWPGAAARR